MCSFRSIARLYLTLEAYLKMLFQTYILLIAIGVSLCEDDICNVSSYQFCGYDSVPTDYPNTVEELKQGCITEQKALNCVIKNYANCPDHEEEIIFRKNLLAKVEAFCREDSPDFQEVSMNIECLSAAARSLDEECSSGRFSEEEYDNLMAVLTEINERKHWACGFAVKRITCATHVVSKWCGPGLTHVVSKIIKNTDRNYDDCTDEVLEDLRPLKEAYEILLIKHDMLEETSVDKK